eukprot:gnl/TRDRNA2_/TRDRNA2_176662_c0_seq3.p1 gnl/TRDRNA2_/TRDRNA2_176662_c0~~gnl/TRDRNA2_/TRDRNA2_176662_c0_seq3.p1  ORF type:complete len:238 (-),score=42.83 gnl/TRDRNA2_/TRDRNA2_176662_c0_seq3:161-874(-)
MVQLTLAPPPVMSEGSKFSRNVIRQHRFCELSDILEVASNLSNSTEFDELKTAEETTVATGSQVTKSDMRSSDRKPEPPPHAARRMPSSVRQARKRMHGSRLRSASCEVAGLLCGDCPEDSAEFNRSSSNSTGSEDSNDFVGSRSQPSSSSSSNSTGRKSSRLRALVFCARQKLLSPSPPRAASRSPNIQDAPRGLLDDAGRACNTVHSLQRLTDEFVLKKAGFYPFDKDKRHMYQS